MGADLSRGGHPEQIVIIGGGIWGLSTAYHLARRGAAGVRVLEQNAEVARETTPRAAGLSGQIRSTPTMCRAIQYALDLLSKFGVETGHDPGLRRPGSLLVALTDARMEAYERHLARAHQNDVKAEFVSHTEMQRLVPAMDVSQLKGGYFIDGDGYVEPRQCALAYAAAAQDLGVTIQCGEKVTGLRIERHRITGVETADGVEPADRVVVTAGPWTGLLARAADFDMAVWPIRHQRVVTVPAAGIPDHHPVVRVTDVSCYMRPEASGYLYGFFEPEPTSIDLSAKPAAFRTDDIVSPVDTMNEARRRLTPIFPILAELDIAERRQGITTFAPDGQYLLGPVPDVEGLILGTGCAALGIAGSAAIGRWLAGWVLDGRPDESLDEFGLTRFSSQAADRSWIRETSEEFYAGYYSIDPND